MQFLNPSIGHHIFASSQAHGRDIRIAEAQRRGNTAVHIQVVSTDEHRGHDETGKPSDCATDTCSNDHVGSG